MSTKRPPTPPAKPPVLRRKRVAPPSDDEDDYVPVSDHNISGDETPVQQQRRSSRRNAAKDVSKEDEGSVRPASSGQARSAKKMPGVSNKRVKVSSAVTTASSLVDDATNHDCPNVQTRNDLMDERGMMLRPDAVSMWTPTAGRLPHVTELEPVDGRSWEVIKVLEHHVTRGDDVLPVWYAVLQDTSKSGSPAITPYRLSPRGERKAILRHGKVVGHHPYPWLSGGTHMSNAARCF